MARQPKIENIFVHTGGIGGQASVHWTIGDRRFHVWMRPNDTTPEDIVHSNPVTRDPNARRDEHRSLDRTCKAQSEIWAEVWAAVERDDLIAKCRNADVEKRDLQRRYTEIRCAIGNLEQEAIEAFRRGEHALQPAAFDDIYTRWRNAMADLQALPALQQEAA